MAITFNPTEVAENMKKYGGFVPGIRPGKPNKAASGFFSGIIREPLAGHDAVLPVSEDLVDLAAGYRLVVTVEDGGRAGGRRTRLPAPIRTLVTPIE